MLRFAVLPPLCWVSPAFRRWVHQHASSMVVDPAYIRPLPTLHTRRVIRLQELLCFLWCWSIPIVPPLVRDLEYQAFVLERLVPFLVQAYLLAVSILTLNHLRTLGAHRWTNRQGREMSFVDQLHDSVPYHALPEATAV